MSSDEDFEMEEVQVPQASQKGPAEDTEAVRTASTIESLNHNTHDDDDEDDDEEGQWEEVDASAQATTSAQPQEGLQITLDKAAVEKRPEKQDAKCVVAIRL